MKRKGERNRGKKRIEKISEMKEDREGDRGKKERERLREGK